MASPKLFDFNSSFGVLRTNPKLTGNIKITLDSRGDVWLNSMDANPTLSDQKFKKYRVTGQNTYAKDIYNFFEEGKTQPDIIFNVGKFTDGENKPVENFASQYDFFYGAGASTLIDRNYTENFRYFQPLWLRDELPEFFVIFKIPEPISYPYTTNQTTIQAGTTYKIIQDVNSTEPFSISYGADNSGAEVVYAAGQFFTGNSLYSTWQTASGSGKVVEFDELLFQPEVDDVESYFNSKILPNATVISTFDLRENTTVGKYIRGIINDPAYIPAPVDFSYQINSYTYYNGVDIQNGTLTRKGELLYDFLISSRSTPQIDFENYVTDGFFRNSIICQNLLNFEFLFNDEDSDLYTINRYFGCYVSRNDLGEFRLNGDYFYTYKNSEGNLNLPKPSLNNVGYYNSTMNNFQSSTGGVRLYYEGASGWIPGSYDVNVLDPQKLYYITDKKDNFYSLARYENYINTNATWINNTPVYAQFGAMTTPGIFGTTGNTGAKTGSLVINDPSVNLLDFTGPDERIGGFAGYISGKNGNANIDIQFLTNLDSSSPITFKIIWPNGTLGNQQEKYDLITSGEFGGTLVGWKAGSSYNIGNDHYFNILEGTPTDIAKSFSECVYSISDSVWDSANSNGYSVVRVKNPGSNQNSQFKISVFSDYSGFETNYIGIWSNTSPYNSGNIVNFGDLYYEALNNVPAPSPGNFNVSPDLSPLNWQLYSTFSTPNVINIAGIDASKLNRNLSFRGGTDYSKSRVAFDIAEKDKIVPGTWIEVEGGRGVTGSLSMIKSVTRYVDEPIYDNDPILTRGNRITGFKGFNEFLVANLADPKAVIDLGSDNNFNLYSMTKLYSGVFSFFDLKDFDFDFFSSNYGITPTPEFNRYFKLIPNQNGQIINGVKYLIREGQIIVDQGTVNERTLEKGEVFIGDSVNYFVDSGFSSTGVEAVVVPAIFTQIGWIDDTQTYNAQLIQAEQNLNSFIGFYGIQSISDTRPAPNPIDKQQVFSYGKLDTEYQYLEENFTTPRANFSRIVPFVNKWGFFGGTDARGNSYRLNASPAFSPTNFSPSFQKDSPDPSYLTHEWMLLEGIPSQYPVSAIGDQQNYLPSKIDLASIRNANPANSLYFSSFFTVEPSDYPSPYNNPENYTKELFTPFVYNRSTGFYDTIFRGVKLSLKRRSNYPNPQNDLDKYVFNYRGFEDYSFAAILRVEPETADTIQAPVKYEFIENVQQKSILFVCTVVIKDYRALPLGYTGGTGGNPYLDYLLMYSLRDKKKDADVGLTGAAGPTGSILYEIDDIKLSAALDGSIVSNSSVTTTANGQIYIIENPEYDTDLREEINLYYPPGSTASVGPTGSGSFSVPNISSTYPWPIGRSENLVNFQQIEAPDYVFDIPFAFSSPTTIPVGPRSAYSGNPVFQIEGGENYFEFILKRISLSQIFERVNNESSYITYTTYDWNPTTQSTVSCSNLFQISLSQPVALFKPFGLYPEKSYSGPQTLGQNQPTGFVIRNGGTAYATDILRYSGYYEPLFKKIFRFKNDKSDTITADPSIDLSFRNCTFAPEQNYFGIVRNLNYSKVSFNNNILEASQNLPEGPVYPLIGQTPIAKKDFSVFLSTWDPGYYNLYSSSTNQSPVAGTRSMKENKSFLGSKMMQTPYTISIYTFITLELSRNSGVTDVQSINTSALQAVRQIQSINATNSNTGIGQLGTYNSNVNLPVFDEGIFPNVEVFWQKDEINNIVQGSIRLDRILRRYLLNSGIDGVFVNNMISEFGVGNPDSIDDDINAYIEQNITPIYEGITFDLFVKKTGQNLSSTELLVRGDLINPDRVRFGYYNQTNFNLTKRNDLYYTFNYSLTPGQNYSLTFSFRIQKI